LIGRRVCVERADDHNPVTAERAGLRCAHDRDGGQRKTKEKYRCSHCHTVNP